MNPLLDIQILGWLLVVLGVFELLPLGVAALSGEPLLPLAASIVVAWAFGLPPALSTRVSDRRMRPRDAFLVVGGGWVLASLFGALPYVFSDTLAPLDALFESVAGFTTTGSTVLHPIEGTPHGILLWRALTQWLGGMGIIVFAVAILPLLGVGGMQLFKAEVPGPVVDKLTPHVADTARRLWLLYVALTVAAGLALLAAGMSPFDALCHSLTLLSTGGFSTRDASIAAFDSAAIEWIVIAFMLVAATNFALLYRAALGQLLPLLRDGELRAFALALVGSVAVVTLLVGRAGDGGPDVLRQSAFQVVSIMTTTGYGTADYETWPAPTHLLLVLLMVSGGMAGSTAGGAKVVRWLLAGRALRVVLARAIHPHSVQPVRYAGREVPDDVVTSVVSFLLGYAVLAALGAAVVALTGYALDTAVSAAVTAIGNVGPGLGAVGPTDHFGHLPGMAKLALCACMLAGRLEIVTLLVLLHPQFWRR